MSVIAPHLPLMNKQDCYDTWKKRGRIAVPSKAGGIVEVWIESITDRGGHLVIEGRTTKAAPLKLFRVAFSDSVATPVLLWRDGNGEWAL
jgi:hypothetical protein